MLTISHHGNMEISANTVGKDCARSGPLGFATMSTAKIDSRILQEVCLMADYIRREDALFALRKAERGGSMTALTRLERAYAEIREMPAADVAEVVHGQWQGEGDGYADGALVYDVWVCSNCGHYIDDGTDDPECLPNYCPSCGAKMDGGFDDATS